MPSGGRTNSSFSRAQLMFPFSCSGTLKFRHNLSIPTGAASKYQLALRMIDGEVHLTDQDADIITVNAVDTSGHFEVYPLVDVDDYS